MNSGKEWLQTSGYQADCEACFGLCCVALPYVKSADFAFSKNGGEACRNLQANDRCGIHADLRVKGFKGCTVYECFGAGQKVSGQLYGGKHWRENSARAEEMFRVFPIVQQLHEMLYYLHESLTREEAVPLHSDLQQIAGEIEMLTCAVPDVIIALDVQSHRKRVNRMFLEVSRLVRSQINEAPDIKRIKSRDLIGANLKGARLAGANLRGVLAIGANLSGADMRKTDLIGADLRDTCLNGANLSGSLYLTQAQVQSAIGNRHTILPTHLTRPKHWH